jgi:Fic family protein
MRKPGERSAFWYFEPAPIPRDVTLAPRTVLALSEADAALGYLQGLGQLITDPYLLIGPYIAREAVASSRIEGTRASLADVLQAGADDEMGSANVEVAEVDAYIKATYQGLKLIESLPLSQRLILEVHRTLLTGVRGDDRLPGELLADWERYVNESATAPVLVQCALMHYQFETIHPFLDGNGRIGRLLIGLLLQQQGRLTSPLLYLSGYLEAHRREYYERLQAVRERGEIQQWLQFFLTAVMRQAQDGVDRAARLVRLRERYLQEAAGSRSRVGEVLALIFANPFVTVRRVQLALEVTNQGARNLIRDSVARGWLEAIVVAGQGRRQYWVAREIFDIVDAPPVYERNRPKL